uniref:Uncharacterized protein n=1 Tax=Lactuca sativa TaxID=4236 RepID=A0A9R1WZ73_LACSA|nr:hypothetical protein LSAT_V11C800412840 [Lactuca sativa]
MELWHLLIMELVDLPNLIKINGKVKGKVKKRTIKVGQVRIKQILLVLGCYMPRGLQMQAASILKHMKTNTLVRAAIANFMSKQIMDQVESNPTIPVKALHEQLQKKYGLAKADAKKIVVGDYKNNYILELQSTNPNTTVKLELVDISESNMVNFTSRCFRRIYVFLRGMKRGF